MPVWEIASIQRRPQVTLIDWSVYEVPLLGPDKPWTRHLVGWACEDRQGQVSSPVQSFDPVTRRCATRSGRVYSLTGRPGSRSDAEYSWTRWKGIWRVTQEREVTNEVAGEMQAAQPAAGDGEAG
jgi:hypothetical protein